MWWLSFFDGGVVLIEASSLVHARTIAALHELGRVSHFAEGHFIDPDRAALIPDNSIGRMLSPNRSPEIAGPAGGAVATRTVANPLLEVVDRTSCARRDCVTLRP